jgi:hypothetical protein
MGSYVNWSGSSRGAPRFQGKNSTRGRIQDKNLRRIQRKNVPVDSDIIESAREIGIPFGD